MSQQPSLLEPDPERGETASASGRAPGATKRRASRRPGSAPSPSRIVDVDIAERMERAFLDYSMSVIVGRALPDVRDGLKPVQRRILHAMWEAGLRPDRPYRKCASAVGDVMKKYHPHGDASIYEALVRMAQDFSTREPLVDGHGNFGSIDGDAAAAMRYTEARLSAIAMEMLDGIDEDTVDLIPNYDGYEREPVVLPARFPNLLVNGASGIAVGMATSIPPHNLGETIDACRHLLAHPQATVDDLMRIVPGPDFPTGARILDTSGIRDAYLTGRGAITMEAIATTETRAGGLPRVVVTELPYQVNKAVLLERIADLVKSRKVDEIRDLRDESSRDGMRVVIELKRGEDPSKVLGKLYRLTDLRSNFNANIVALASPRPGDAPQPRTLGLVDALRAYLAHQRTVLTRRSEFRRAKAAARAHVLEGLLIALDHIDEVIALIRGSATADEARSGLMEHFGLTETQATAILDMQLRRLAALERERLAGELAELRERIAELDGILGDPAVLDQLLDRELAELKSRHANPRRSRLSTVAEPSGEQAVGGTQGAGAVTLEAQPVLVTVSAGAYLRSATQRRTSPAHGHPRDPLVAALRTTTAATLLLVDTEGGGYRLAAADLPSMTARQRGVTLAQLAGDPPAAPLAGAVVLDASPSVLTVSASGLVKRTERSEYEGRARAMAAAGVRKGDRIVALLPVGEDDQLLLAHAGGLVIRFPMSEVRTMGRTAAGVAGLKIPKGQRLVAASVIPGGREEGRAVLTLGATGEAKRTPLAEYPVQGRGGKGVQTGTDRLAWCGVATDLHVPLAESWSVLRAELANEGRRAGRGGPGTDPLAGTVVPEWGPLI
ncbi:MAG: DNA topoisomerase 4 subunit A [Nitriliruptorales bacterium]|nr:DNA topoisomerase 4 subunit A [Nitriliruptorales bacterium]